VAGSVVAGDRVDCIVIGAGVVGLACARELALRGREVLVLEQEGMIGSGISSRNSEVIHSGIYYPTGSLKARLCVEGRERLYRYCAEHGVEHAQVGKLIVATRKDEVAKLEDYRARALANDAGDLALLDARAVHSIEPEVSCVAALWSPRTGIVDSHGYMLALQADLEARGGEVVTRSPVVAGRVAGHELVIVAGRDVALELSARTVVNAAGLMAPSISRLIDGVAAGHVPHPYFAKGHYYSLTGRSPFGHLVYPVAGSGGLGVHVTLDLAGQARFGPDIEWIDNIDYSFDDSRRASFVEAIRRYYPALDPARLQPAYTGIRPKLVPKGTPDADFRIDGPAQHGMEGYVALYGIESPGLTATLSIADRVANCLDAARGT